MVTKIFIRIISAIPAISFGQNKIDIVWPREARGAKLTLQFNKNINTEKSLVKLTSFWEDFCILLWLRSDDGPSSRCGSMCDSHGCSRGCPLRAPQLCSLFWALSRAHPDGPSSRISRKDVRTETEFGPSSQPRNALT